MMYDFELREQADENLAAADYDRLYHSFPVPELWDADFVTYLGRQWHAGDRVLDLGCATASLWDRWSALPAPSRLVGVDISEQMIEIARQKHPDGEFHVARAHALPFPDGSFDLVVASSVLHHIPDSHLDGALTEIVRVLDEHGRLVGRDPIENTLVSTPGWFSGALMNFRHFVYRVTRSREFPEPELGEHHHVFDEDALLAAIQMRLAITSVERRFPFSSLVSRIRDDRIARIASALDVRAGTGRGSMVYYNAEKNYVPADEVLRAVRLARDEVPGVSDAEFLAYVQAATIEIARLFDEPIYERGSDTSS